MENLGAILEFVDDELGAIRKNGRLRNKDDIETVYKLVDIAKDTYCIWKYEEEMGDNYSGTMVRRPSMSYRNRDSYSSRTDRNRYGYSYGDGMDQYVNMLHKQLDNARDDRQREVIERMIDEAERNR